MRTWDGKGAITIYYMPLNNFPFKPPGVAIKYILGVDYLPQSFRGIFLAHLCLNLFDKKSFS